MRRLGLSPFDIELIVLSHGHSDHVTGLDGFVRAVGPSNLPLVVHPGAFTKRRIAIPGLFELELPSPSRKALQQAGLEVIERRQPRCCLTIRVLITGEVDRTSDFEHGMPFHEALTDGAWAPDPLILDDQALIVHVAGHGLIVLTGCGHAGIVNIVRYARRLTGIETVAAVVGGFHLSGPAFEPIIKPTVDALAEIGGRVQSRWPRTKSRQVNIARRLHWRTRSSPASSRRSTPCKAFSPRGSHHRAHDKR